MQHPHGLVVSSGTRWRICAYTHSGVQHGTTHVSGVEAQQASGRTTAPTQMNDGIGSHTRSTQSSICPCVSVAIDNTTLAPERCVCYVEMYRTPRGFAKSITIRRVPVESWCAITNYKIRRGAYGKPWVTRDGCPLDWPEGEPKPRNAYLYGRISDLSSNLEDKTGLSPYHQAQAVFGAVTHKHLFLQFRALASEYENPWSSAKEEVKDLLRQCRMAGGEEKKSGTGTGFHRYAHLVDEQREIDFPVNDLEPWLWCYGEAMRSRFTVLRDEVFVVVDDIEHPGSMEDICCAGSFDRLVRDNETGEVMIADIKTGASDNDWAMAPTIQVAGYAHGVVYDQQTGSRTQIHPELSLTRGLLIHVPINGGGEPECTIYPLDIERGWQLGMNAADAAKAKKMKCLKRDALAKAKA